MAENCVLKGVRVFMVLREIERLGTIVKSMPSLKDLEDEKFDLEFIVAVLMSNPPEELAKSISNITDIAQVSFEKIDPQNLPMEKRMQNQSVEERTKVTGQTVRVDIRKLDVLMNLVAELVINRSRLEAISSNLRSKDLEGGFGTGRPFDVGFERQRIKNPNGSY